MTAASQSSSLATERIRVQELPLVSSASVNSPPADSECSSRKGCVSCLVQSGSARCIWCASSRQCVPAPSTVYVTQGSNPKLPVSLHQSLIDLSFVDAHVSASTESCPDVEFMSCPAVLHTPIPQTFRVIHVAIRKGGPEALVQLHLALNHWGFNTTLDTRHSKKQKGGPVVPFFREMYAEEFARAPKLRWEKNYDSWIQSAREGDVLIATETWSCFNDIEFFQRRGARQMQWHLTVWPKKARDACTIASHTNYIAQHYMQQSTRSLMFPYISPHIVQFGLTGTAVKTSKDRLFLDSQDLLRNLNGKEKNWRTNKRQTVMYDGDVLLKDSDLKPLRSSAAASFGLTPADLKDYSVRKATGFTPVELYTLYGETKAGIDLKLPGAERFIYEASLFDVCIIVDKTANGMDEQDLPIPDRFRVAPDNMDALHERIAECLSNYDKVIEEFTPLKEHVLSQRTNFHRHVRRYYSNSIHIVTYVQSTKAADEYLFDFLLSTMLQLPFAVIEVVYPRELFHSAEALLSTGQRKLLMEHNFLAAVMWTSVPTALADWVNARPTTTERRVAFVAAVPLHARIISGEWVHLGSTLLARVKGEGACAALSVKNRFVFSHSTCLKDPFSTGSFSELQDLSSWDQVPAAYRNVFHACVTVTVEKPRREVNAFLEKHSLWTSTRKMN